MIDFIKDADCTKETPVRLGVPDAPIYGKGIKLKPRVDGRTDSEHFKKIYLPELLPLEEYDLIVVLISGGKDSVACYLKLLELGVPKERIEFWHHDIDGGHPSRRMDWKCTQNYVKALADAEGIKLRVSYRVNGFFGELYRIGASEPIEWIDPDTGEVRQCKLSSNYLKCKELKEQATEEMEELLKKYGYRMKFPAKTGDLSRRWCSAYLKICVADTVVSNLDRLGELEELGGKRHKFPAKGGTHSGRWCSGNLKAAVQDSVTANLEETKRDKKILIVSGERRGESAGRSKYNEMEIHRTNAEAKAHRIVHQWRCCIDYSEKDVWELLKRHHINPHPCYRIGWNRCSCMMCIFSTPRLFAGVKELFPDDYAALRHDEEVLAKAADLVANDYVTFKAADLAVTAGTPLTGGTNGTVDGTAHQAYLDKIESYTYNTMGVVVTDDITKKLYVAFNKRLRDELGIKFQLVVYNLSADYMGVISVKNKVTDAGWSEAALVYWVTGAESGCAVNKSCQNKKYDGGFTVDTNYTQNELKAAIKAGEFTFHKVNGVVRVLEDINSMVTTSDTCGDVFKDNQTIRVIDQLGNDDAVLFNTKYLGVVPNNASGRTSLWSDLVKIRTQLQELGAIEGFTDSDVTVAQGDSKKAVVITSAITVVNAMGKLYETVTVA